METLFIRCMGNSMDDKRFGSPMNGIGCVKIKQRITVLPLHLARSRSSWATDSRNGSLSKPYHQSSLYLPDEAEIILYQARRYHITCALNLRHHSKGVWSIWLWLNEIDMRAKLASA